MNVEIVKREEEKSLEIRANVIMWKLSKIMPQSYKELYDYAIKNGEDGNNCPYACYENIDWEELRTQSKIKMLWQSFTKKWELRMGLPIEKNISGEGNIKNGTLEKGEFVKAIHKGAYHKVGDTYKIMHQFIRENNIKIESRSIEKYLNDPSKVEKNNLETEVLIPIKI